MSQDMSRPPIKLNPFISPMPRDTWVELEYKAPPFNTHLLFQTVDNIVFFGFRREDDTFTGVAITKDNLYTVESEYKDVVRWNLASDPAQVIPTEDKQNEITKINLLEGIEVSDELRKTIDRIQESN